MDFNIKVTGIEDCINFINSIPELIDDDNLKQLIGENSIKIINQIAQSRLENYSNYIQSNKIKTYKTGVIIYNDVEDDYGFNYSLIVEYGSGLNAEEQHIGTTEEFIESGFEWWYAGRHIKVTGQNPKHIYTDAAIEISRLLPKWVTTYVNDVLLKGVV